MTPEMMCIEQASTFTTPAKKAGYLADCTRRNAAIAALRVEGARQSMLMFEIPEYHDEQRLDDGASGLGPVVMIFASPGFGGIEHEGQIVEHGPRGVLAAIIRIDPASGPLPATYRERLKLSPGWNCLWLKYTPRSAVEWSAFMTVPKDASSPCDPDQARQPLGVGRTQYQQFREVSSIPAAARITWDESFAPLFGVRCAAGWCDVGPADGSGKPIFKPKSLIQDVLALRDRREARIVGWHDEQTLVEYGADGVIRPGTIKATLIPLHSQYRNVGVFRNPNGWAARGPDVDVAILYLHDDPVNTRYADNWHLVQGMNTIALRNEGTTWYATVRNKNGTFPWKNADRTEHYDAAVISTARFRWASTDDGVWIACGQACCRMEGET